ncbi:MAG: LytR C-terminal domain-containing protein [Candidatus Moranbacteria bacterium]|nr:LytR C-terminal domain-containing protein [Candidatus Moranbacteria bacterium]
MGIFSKQKNIIFISHSRLRAVQVNLGRANAGKVIEDIVWNKETLPSILSVIRTKIGSDIQLALSEDLVYVVSFALKNATKYTRLTIKQEASSFIPENLDEVPWDFRSIAAIVGDKRIGVSKGVQVAAVSKVFLHDIAPAFVSAGFVVEAMEAESCALARLMHDQASPILIVHTDHDRTLLVILERGVVMATQNFAESIHSDDIERFISSAQKHFSLRIASVIFSEESTKSLGDVRDSLQSKGFSVQEASFDPILGLALKKDIRGNDADVLNVNLLPQEKRNFLSLIRSPREKRLLIIFFIVFILGSVAVSGMFMFNRSVKAPIKQESVIADIPIEVAKPSVPQDNADGLVPPSGSGAVADYAISILNGSGIRGEAAGVEKLVRAEGATKVRIGNADNNSYTKTKIRAKKTVPPSMSQSIVKVLSSRYVVEDVEILDDGAEDDIMVIVGSQKNE